MEDIDEDHSNSCPEDGVLPGINFLLAEGFETPQAAGPQKKLHFATPADAANGTDTVKRALFNSLSSTADSVVTASPGDSLIVHKGSPLMESPMSGLVELNDFKDANQILVGEAEAADARLAEAEQTLADLKYCDDQSAAYSLARMGGQPDNDEVNRKLKLHLAEQRKMIAEAEVSIKRHLTGR